MVVAPNMQMTCGGCGGGGVGAGVGGGGDFDKYAQDGLMFTPCAPQTARFSMESGAKSNFGARGQARPILNSSTGNTVSNERVIFMGGP